MDCLKSLELLSDYHDGVLDETNETGVRMHLTACPGCTDVFRDLDSIVVAATLLHEEGTIPFPDEDALWRRMNLTTGPIH
ncbi:MAG: anti-sigma factor family protein [Pyrinomonadaceae bacterium]